MQITPIKIFNNQQKPSFKAIPNRILVKEAKATLSNPKSKEIFTKLAGIAGLSGIISYIASFIEKNSTSENEELEKLLNTVDKKANSYLLNTETIGEYLDITSSADTAEAALWAKTKEDAPSDKKEEVKSTSNKLTLDFLEEASKSKLASILKQTKIISEAENSEALSKVLEEKLFALASKAQELRSDSKTSDLFTKLASIAKAEAVINLIDNEEKEEDILKEDTPVTVIEETPKEAEPITNIIDETTTGSEQKLIDEKDLPKVTIVDKIDIRDDGRKRFRPKDAVIEIEPTKEIVITDSNKDFVKNIFLKAFIRNASVKPENYADMVDFIQKIYYSYPEEKALRQNLLKRLKHENNLKVLEMYYEYTKGEPAKVDFINFMDLERLKRRNCGSLTQEDFDKLMQYKDNIIKYYKISEADERISLTFLENISVEERLKAITEFHKIAFNLSENNLFNAVTKDEITIDDVKDELIRKLSENSEDYANIVDFIGLDVTDIGYEVKKGDKDEAISLTKELLDEQAIQKNINALVDILNNKAFIDFIGNTHARMRFMERVVFKDSRNFGKSVYELKKATSKEIEKLKKLIEGAQYLDVTNYPAIKDAGRYENRFSPQIILRGTTIALNDKAQIHTIY